MKGCVVMSFQVIKGDITTCAVDAIVNAANTSLLGGGGVDGAIHRAAGPDLLKECRTLHGCQTGQAKITAGYNLPAKHVIHTPGPVWQGGDQNEPGLLASCYRSCLRLAEENGCRTVAFPSISTGVYHFPLEQAAAIAVKEILAFLEDSNVVREVTMVCFDDKTKAAYDAALQKKSS
jgi:O-acetyl-ADP-ribose deacetylase (regulator of RNase III)